MKVPLADSFVGGKLLLFSVPPPLFLVYSCPCDLTWDASVLEQSALLPFFLFLPYFHHLYFHRMFHFSSQCILIISYTMSRREKKKNGRPLIVFEQIFANHVYPLCGSAHPSMLQHALFSGIPAGAKVVCVAGSIVITPVVCVCVCLPLLLVQ